MVDISDSLTFAETRLQDFRASNEVMDLDFKANQVFTIMRQLEDQKAQLIVKSKYYKNLQDYLIKHKESIDDIVVPSSMGIDDPLLTQLITELAKLYTERAQLLLNSSERNPYVVAIDQRIATTKNTISENIQNIINTSSISIKDIDERIGRLELEIGRLPQTQRQLFGIERTFKLNDAITPSCCKTLGSTNCKSLDLPDNEIIDVARGGDQVFQKKGLNYLIAYSWNRLYQ